MKMTKFWYSADQAAWYKHVNQNPIVSGQRPILKMFCIIDGCVLEYTECHTPRDGDDNYEPLYDDKVFLGCGEYACGEHGIQTYLKLHPELHFGKHDEWPDEITLVGDWL